MNLPMLGTAEKTKDSKYQVTLVDSTDKSLRPIDYPRTNRFFEHIADRNTFVRLFESEIQKAGGKLVKNRLNHPLFTSFHVVDQNGDKSSEITIYH